MDNAFEPTKYELRQRHNAITAWLHSFRYRQAVRVVESLGLDRPVRVVEIGCGLAKLFDVLKDRVPIEYTGIDREPHRLGIAQARYGHHADFRLIENDAWAGLNAIDAADVVFALETLEHIRGTHTVRIIERIATLRPLRFVCSVPVEIGPAIWAKNIGSALCGYIRHREYTWRETFWAGLYRLDKLPPHGAPCLFGYAWTIGHKGFDWRWLAQTIHQQMRVREIRKSPFRLLPAAISTSVMIVAEPR